MNIIIHLILKSRRIYYLIPSIHIHKDMNNFIYIYHMKHIKPFQILEGYGYENQEITFQKWVEMKPTILLTNNQISIIKKLIDKWNYDLPGDFSNSGDSNSPRFYRYIIKYDGGKNYKLEIEIAATDDDWFKVNYFIETFNAGRFCFLTKYYKCDQIGGLIELLEQTFKNIPPYTPISI